MATVTYGDFEWDADKEAANRSKHGVGFDEAATAVLDPNALFFPDLTPKEPRIRVVGMSRLGRLLLVVIVERGDHDRVISAREATTVEETQYATGG